MQEGITRRNGMELREWKISRDIVEVIFLALTLNFQKKKKNSRARISFEVFDQDWKNIEN